MVSYIEIKQKLLGKERILVFSLSHFRAMLSPLSQFFVRMAPLTCTKEKYKEANEAKRFT